jgi:glycosyltransferase involved in cell wall biosynthesis
MSALRPVLLFTGQPRDRAPLGSMHRKAHNVDRALPPHLLDPQGESGASLSIVIPVYNSESTIGRLCDALIEGLASRWRLQIVLVDDGSRDHSAQECCRLHHHHRGIVDCVLLSKNFGEHNAVMAGLHQVRGRYCVIMDDDFQNPPSEVESLLTEIAKGYDVIYVRYANKQHHLWRNLGSRLHNFMATHALKKPADLYLSSFKALSYFLVREIIQYTGPDPYLDAIVLRTTRRIGTVAVKHQTRATGESGYTTAKLLSLWSNMIVGFSIYPLRIVAILGFFIAVLGILFGLFGTITLGSSVKLDPEQVEALYGPRWLVRGSTLMAVCIVGEYIGRIYRHLNRSPQFIIREKFVWPIDGSTDGKDACDMPGRIEPKPAGVRENFERS